MGKNWEKNSKGFTLVEAIVALAIFVIIATFAFPIFLSSATVNKAAHDKLQVQEISQNLIESAINLSNNSENLDQLIAALIASHQELGFVFERIDNQLIMTSQDYEVVMTFSEEGQRLNLRGQAIASMQTFETVEWLNYEK